MDIDKIIKLYKKYNNYSKVERETGINRKTVKKILIENDIEVKNINQHKLNLSEDDIKNIITMYHKGVSTKEIGKEYNCNSASILRILKSKGIDTSRKRYNHNFKKYNINEHYFDEINTERKAYFLGFILADGCIYDTKLIIALQEKDVYLLYDFVRDLDSNHPIQKHYKYNTYILNIGSKVLTDKLKEIGICERKSYNIDFDKVLSYIPLNLRNHFIRGIFDGDGCIKKYKQTYYDKYFYHFSITGLKNVVSWCKEYLGIENKIIQDKRTKSLVTYYCLTRKTSTLKNIFNIMYKDATIYLNRKYEIFKEI